MWRGPKLVKLFLFGYFGYNIYNVLNFFLQSEIYGVNKNTLCLFLRLYPIFCFKIYINLGFAHSILYCNNILTPHLFMQATRTYSVTQTKNKSFYTMNFNIDRPIFFVWFSFDVQSVFCGRICVILVKLRV